MAKDDDDDDDDDDDYDYDIDDGHVDGEDVYGRVSAAADDYDSGDVVKIKLPFLLMMIMMGY